MLQLKHIHKNFGGVTALKNCSFMVNTGKITALIGPNGAGKTTIFNVITGFTKQDSGELLFDEVKIDNDQPYRRSQLGIARTFQTIRLFSKMTVMENLLLAMPDTHENVYQALFHSKKIKKQEKENEKKAFLWLHFVGLHSHANTLTSHLSYGQQKLLEIARALSQEPKLLMLDEPAAGVNPTMLKKIKELLLQLKKKGMTIFFIEHDMEFVMNLADTVIVLDYGEEIATGKPSMIKKNKKVIDAYLGGDQ